jgi:SAM-dependent methyltransferase
MPDFSSFAAQIREPRQASAIPLGVGFEQRVVDRLRRLGVLVNDFLINVDKYRQYVKRAEYRKRYPDYYSTNFAEKSLEHFIAAELLALSANDTYIDIASEQSPVPEIYRRLFGVSSFRQDLTYPPGMHGDTIGSDAVAMPVPDGFASKVALHCSFEHFEGDADIRFVREVRRVLRPGGAACIVPLYMAEAYSVMTDPTVSVPAGVQFEADSTVYCVNGWGNRYGRFYDPEHFAARIARSLGELTAVVYRITNGPDVDPSCYVRFALVLSSPRLP